MNEITKAYTSYITLIAVIISLLYFFNALPHRLSKTSNYDVEENGSPHIVNESSSKRLTEFDHNSFKEFSEKLFPSEYAGIDIAGVPSILDLPDYQLYTKRHIFSKSIIESNVFIGPHTVFANDLHPPCPRYLDCVQKTYVESFVSIGANVTIAPGIRIGHHSQIYAGAVIIKDVEPNSVIGGNPGRFIKHLDELECKPDYYKKPFEWWDEPSV